jgi:hypothetical protein
MKIYLHSPNTPSWRGAQLKHRGNFTFTFYMYWLNDVKQFFSTFIWKFLFKDSHMMCLALDGMTDIELKIL